MSDLQTRLREAIENKGLTHQALADLAEINKSYLTRLLSGERGERIEYGTAYRLAKALGVDVHALVTGEGWADDPIAPRARAARFALADGMSARACARVQEMPALVNGGDSAMAWLLLIYGHDLLLREKK